MNPFLAMLSPDPQEIEQAIQRMKADAGRSTSRVQAPQRSPLGPLAGLAQPPEFLNPQMPPPPPPQGPIGAQPPQTPDLQQMFGQFGPKFDQINANINQDYGDLQQGIAGELQRPRPDATQGIAGQFLQGRLQDTEDSSIITPLMRAIIQTPMEDLVEERVSRVFGKGKKGKAAEVLYELFRGIAGGKPEESARRRAQADLEKEREHASELMKYEMQMRNQQQQAAKALMDMQARAQKDTDNLRFRFYNLQKGTIDSEQRNTLRTINEQSRMLQTQMNWTREQRLEREAEEAQRRALMGDPKKFDHTFARETADREFYMRYDKPFDRATATPEEAGYYLKEYTDAYLAMNKRLQGQKALAPGRTYITSPPDMTFYNPQTGRTEKVVIERSPQGNRAFMASDYFGRDVPTKQDSEEIEMFHNAATDMSRKFFDFVRMDPEKMGLVVGKDLFQKLVRSNWFGLQYNTDLVDYLANATQMSRGAVDELLSKSGKQTNNIEREEIKGYLPSMKNTKGANLILAQHIHLTSELSKRRYLPRTYTDFSENGEWGRNKATREKNIGQVIRLGIIMSLQEKRPVTLDQAIAKYKDLEQSPTHLQKYLNANMDQLIKEAEAAR